MLFERWVAFMGKIAILSVSSDIKSTKVIRKSAKFDISQKDLDKFVIQKDSLSSKLSAPKK